MELRTGVPRGRYDNFVSSHSVRLSWADSGEDGDSVFLRNVGIPQLDHTALQPRRPTSTTQENCTGQVVARSSQ
jgi:hypothetical protein